MYFFMSTTHTKNVFCRIYFYTSNFLFGWCDKKVLQLLNRLYGCSTVEPCLLYVIFFANQRKISVDHQLVTRYRLALKTDFFRNSLYYRWNNDFYCCCDWGVKSVFLFSYLYIICMSLHFRIVEFVFVFKFKRTCEVGIFF